MTQSEAEAKLTQELKSYIKKTHYETGSLADSARVDINGLNDISVVANDYIQYLDNGDFVDKFFDLDSVNAILEEYIVSEIEDQLQLAITHKS